MLKFFRKIREKSLSNNKIRKYFIYAFGEVILVVIGILIALQINSCNDENKEYLLETEILKELAIALEGDLEDLNYNLKAHKNILESQKTILNWLNNDLKYSDSLSEHFFNSIDGTNFLSKESSYETLKQIGIRLIKNDTLRSQISNTYELRYKDYRSVLEQINLYRFSLVNQEFKNYFKGTSPYFKMVPLNDFNIKDDSNYKYHIQTISSLNNYFIYEKIEPTKLAVEKTISAIKTELTKRN